MMDWDGGCDSVLLSLATSGSMVDATTRRRSTVGGRDGGRSKVREGKNNDGQSMLITPLIHPDFPPS